MDDFTERLVEAVEIVKNNIMLDVEYKAYYAKLQDKYYEGLKTGLFAVVKTLKPILGDLDKVYNAVIENEEYADITREEVMEYYQRCP